MTDLFKICSGLFDALPDRSNVAVVTMTGSCCPVTLAHIQAFDEAKLVLLGKSSIPRPERMETFTEVLGLLSLNSDSHVASKMKEKGEPYIAKDERAMLVGLATAEYNWLIFNPFREHDAFERIESRWPHLVFKRYGLNGADDVLKYQKWNDARESRRYITMGRPGFTDRVLRGAKLSNVDLDQGYFIMGPELPDVSSTAVRNALKSSDVEALKGLLHPHVAEWCISSGPYGPSTPKGDCIAETGIEDAIVERDDGGRQTALRRIAMDERSDDVFLPGQESVRNGERVIVLASGGEHGHFALIRAIDGTEGFIKLKYLVKCSSLASAKETATVSRMNGISTTLRKIPIDERSDAVFLKESVKNGEKVEVLAREGDYAKIRTVDGTEGYIRSQYLH